MASAFEHHHMDKYRDIWPWATDQYWLGSEDYGFKGLVTTNMRFDEDAAAIMALRDDADTAYTSLRLAHIYGPNGETPAHLTIGDAGTTGHSLASEDDLLITGKLEVDGATYLDSTVGIIGAVTISPAAAGTFLDFELETEWVSGTLIRADFASATTISDDVIGMMLDFNTQVTMTTDKDVTGYQVKLPPLTQTANNTTTIIGYDLPTAGALVSNSGTSVINWYGHNIQMPAITETSGTMSSHGLLITGGAVTSGTETGITITTGAYTAGVQRGIHFTTDPNDGCITGGADITIDPTNSLNVTLTDDDADALDIANSAVSYYLIDTRNTVAGVKAHTFDTEDAVIASGNTNVYSLATFPAYTLTYTTTTAVTSLITSVIFGSPTITHASALAVTKATTIQVAPPIEGTLTLATSSAIRILNAASGTPTTQVGLYIEDLTAGGSDYAIYIAGADTAAIYIASSDPIQLGAANDIIFPANTAAALELSDGTTKYYTINTLTGTVAQFGHTIDVSDPTITSAAGAVYGMAKFNAYTLNYGGATNVTTEVVNVDLQAVSLVSDTATLTIDDATTLKIVAPTESTQTIITEARAIHIVNAAGTPVTQYGIYIDSLTAGATADYSIYTNAGQVHFGGALDLSAGITIDPTTTGTFLDFVLETEWTSGTLIRADWGSGVTATEAIVGMLLDFTNLTPLATKAVYGYELKMPAFTQTAASTTNLVGFTLTTAGALEQNTGAGTINWFGALISMPDINAATGSIVSQGITITPGSWTAGTERGIHFSGDPHDGAITSAASLTFKVADSFVVVMGDDDSNPFYLMNSGDYYYLVNTQNTVVGQIAHLFDTEDVVLVAAANAVSTLLSTNAYNLSYTGATQVTDLQATVNLQAVTLAGAVGVTVDKATTLEVIAPVESTNVTLTHTSAIRILNAGGTPANHVGIMFDATLTGGTATNTGIDLTSNTIINAGKITATNAAGPAILNEAATATNPTLCPNRAEEDTGIGWTSTDIINIVLGGANEYAFSTTTLDLKNNTLTNIGAANTQITGTVMTWAAGGQIVTTGNGALTIGTPSGTGDLVLQVNAANMVLLDQSEGDVVVTAGLVLAAATAPTTGDSVWLVHDNTGDLTANVRNGKAFHIAENGTDEYDFTDTALAMNGNNITGLGSIGSTGAITITPGAAGTFIDFELETEWVSGTLINADFGGATTLNDDTIGMLMEFNNNVTMTADKDLTIFQVKTPALTSSTNVTTNIIGWDLPTAGALNQSAAGAIVWKGVNIQMPNINETTGTTTSYGIYVAGGTVTAGTEWGIYLNSCQAYFGGKVGINEASPSNMLHVTDTGVTARIERQVIDDSSTHNVLFIEAYHSDADTMLDGFGAQITWLISDTNTTSQIVGSLGVVRAGADNTGDIVFRPATTGTTAERMRLTSGGDLYVKGVSGAAVNLYLWADAGEDNSDKWLVSFADGGDMTIQSYTSGAWVTKLTLTNASALTVTTIGAFQATGAIDFNSQACTSIDINSGTIAGVTIDGDLTWSSAQTGVTLTSPTINGTIATTGLTLPAITLSGTVTCADQAMTGVGDMTFTDGSVLQTGTAVDDWFSLQAYRTHGNNLDYLDVIRIANTAVENDTGLLGFYGAAAVNQPAHIADPAACAANTFGHLWDGATDPTAEEGAELIADLAALKTAIDANNAAVDSILAQLAELGLQAAA